MSIETWLAFFVAAWAISLSPGAGAVAAMSSGLRHGLRRGYWTTIGLQLGILMQLAVVAAGVGTLLAASQIAFETVRWLGVAYLLWLGIQQWRAGSAGAQMLADDARATTRRALLTRGFAVNASNPKAIVFMLAVVPQFIDIAQPLIGQYLVIAATLVAVDMIVMGGYTGLAAKLLRLLREPRQVRILNRVFGGLFVVVAIALASFRRAG
jgi:homoserine/homoserine lactone efflux protein